MIIVLIMYAVSLLQYVLLIVDQITHGFITVYIIGTVFKALIFLGAIVFLIIKKRQGGLGVTLPLNVVILFQFFDRIYYSIGIGFYVPPSWRTLLLLIASVAIIVFFSKPNAILKITSTVFVALNIVSIIIGYTYNAFIDMFDSYNVDIMFDITDIIIFALIIVQINMSFKILKQQKINIQSNVQPIQQVYAQPVQQVYAQPVQQVYQPVYQQPIQQVNVQQPTIKYCTNCGTKMQIDDVFCPECGTKDQEMI